MPQSSTNLYCCTVLTYYMYITIFLWPEDLPTHIARWRATDVSIKCVSCIIFVLHVLHILSGCMFLESLPISTLNAVARSFYLVIN